jgi:hypothetical protein
VCAHVLPSHSTSRPSPCDAFGTKSAQTRHACLGSVVDVDEARKVIERLARIDSLERGGCPAEVMLAEVRALLHEAEAWVRAEPGGTERAAGALERSREALAARDTREEVTA